MAIYVKLGNIGIGVCRLKSLVKIGNLANFWRRISNSLMTLSDVITDS
jgi:hypothetical protein